MVLPLPMYAQGTSPPTATPSIGNRADACEPNDQPDQACNLPLDAVSGPYTFLPAGDQDWYRLDLGAANGLRTVITVRSVTLDLLTTITRDDRSSIGTISSPVISTTLASDVGGGVLLHIENRTPSDPSGQTYNIEVRRTLPPTPSPMVRPNTPDVQPDALENNYDADHATPIGVGVVYDLNFVCPVAWPGACGGGDHDYLRFETKRGVTYVLATFDLGPGVDSVLDVFWGTTTQPVATNDDAGPLGFASLLRWKAPDNGTAVIRIGPRTGGLDPVVIDPKASTYRFAIALNGSDLATQITGRVVAQTQPTPTAQPTAPSAASSSGMGSSTSSGNTTSGTTGTSRQGGAVTAASVATPLPMQQVTTPTALGPQPIANVDIAELPVPTVAVPTAEPRIAVPIGLRVGYDRNANKVLDIDEGVRGLTVYVANAQGVLLGQALTDQTGGVQLLVRANANEQLTVSVPYFAAAQVISARAPQVQPIIIAASAPLPGVLP